MEEHVFKNTFYTRLTPPSPPPPLGLVSGCIMLFLKILYINQNCINSKSSSQNCECTGKRESQCGLEWNEKWNEIKCMLISVPTLKKRFGGNPTGTCNYTEKKNFLHKNRFAWFQQSPFLFKHTTSLRNDKTDIVAVVFKDLLRILIFWCMWFTLFLICFLST